jgi:hypothetical protein
MCNFERKRIKVDITSDGFLRATEPESKGSEKKSGKEKA